MDDGRLVGFWDIDEIRPLNEECPELATLADDDFFVFADYSIWALGYAVRFGTGQDYETAVFLIGERSVDVLSLITGQSAESKPDRRREAVFSSSWDFLQGNFRFRCRS
jgi:hypothetical protein